MYKLLLIGDVHVVPEELDDSQALIDYIKPIALEHKAKVCFMGDLFNTMAVIRSEVLNFWNTNFRMMDKLGIKLSALVGNHDFSGEGLFTHALVAYEAHVQIIDQFADIAPGVLALPYYSDHKAMLEVAQKSKAKTLLAHQTFTGANYGGFYAPDGIDPELFPQENIISGHIHTPQSFGKVTYIGAPRWRTLSDANIDRAIWLYEFDDEGNVLNKRSFSTNHVCRQIRYLQDSPLTPIDVELSNNVDWRIDIKGPADYIEKRKNELTGPGIKIRTFKTTGTKPAIKESDGIGVAFRKYASKYVPKHGTEKDHLISMAKDRLNV